MAATNKKVRDVSSSFNKDETPNDAKVDVTDTHTSELVIALCGPIGSPLHEVSEALKSDLEREYSYDKCEVIRLSKFIKEKLENPNPEKEFEKIKSLITHGNKMRASYGANILSELAINKIAYQRNSEKRESGSKNFKPRRVCHIIDSIKNQEELDILRLVYRDILYVVGVFSPMPIRVKNLEKRGLETSEVFELIDRDSGEEFAHGQSVRDTFPYSDFFLRSDTSTDTQLKEKTRRFLDLILGSKIVTPTHHEKAMHAASAAANNSACLSRQVGAALTDNEGDILSLGWNDVPKFSGGLYQNDPVTDPAGHNDKRCWNIEGGKCFNDYEKQILTNTVVDELKSAGLITNTDSAKEIIKKNSKIKNLIEFSRSVHAEMHAIIIGSQVAGSRVRNGRLYCTTYPCHSCARHIIAAGIREVYYIEPYRKSLATKLHDDAITEDEADSTKVRILPYEGVAPARYHHLFSMTPEGRKKDGRLIQVEPQEARPRHHSSLEAMPTLEALVIKELKAKRLIEGAEDEETE